MVSVYGYITVANLEAYSGIDYSATAGAFTDAIIEACITQAERMINTKCGSTFTGTIPDAIIAATTEIAYRLMYNRMVWLGIMDRENPKKEIMPIWGDDIESIIEPYMSKNISPIYNHVLWSAS